MTDKALIKEQAVTALQSSVNSWLAENSRRSLASLSRESGVSESSLRRLLNNSTWPSQDNVFKLISYLGNGNIVSTVNALAEPLKNQIKFDLYYLDFKELKKYVSLGGKDSALKDFTHQVVFERSSIGPGISVAEIRELFGAYGLTAVENLKVAGLITEVDSTIKCVAEYKYHAFTTQMTKDFLAQSIATFYKTQTNYNYIFSFNDGVTTSGYGQIMDILENAQQAIFKIIEDSPGDIPVTIGGFMDTLTTNVLFDKAKVQS